MYLLFLKHWLIEKMPPTARTGLVFIDDSQGHGSLQAMVDEFALWGQAFAPAPVGFHVIVPSTESPGSHGHAAAARSRVAETMRCRHPAR
jgi:hypothetical protein